MVFNCTVLVDALDELRSDFDRLPGGPVFHIRKYAFQFEGMRQCDIFRLTSFRVSPIYFSDRAVRLWEKAGISGVKFRELWARDDRPLKAGGL